MRKKKIETNIYVSLVNTNDGGISVRIFQRKKRQNDGFIASARVAVDSRNRIYIIQGCTYVSSQYGTVKELQDSSNKLSNIKREK